MNTFQKILSYCIDLPLEKVQSQYSGEVEVSFHRGAYKLSTKNAIYSFGKNYTSFETAFNALNIKKQTIKSVLVLGYGLGSVVDLLEVNNRIEYITAVDADAVIIDLAKKYTQTSLIEKVQFVCMDATTFIQTNQQQFDLILFDVFMDDETPIEFMQTDFLKNLKKCAAQNAILIYSKIDASYANKIENKQFETVFTNVFPESFSIDASGNKMYVWIQK